MNGDQNQRDELFAGLQLLADSAFPKVCASCGRRYENLDALIEHSRPADEGSGLAQQSAGTGIQVMLERQCDCGAPLEAFCSDRRSAGELGQKRRALFERLLSLLLENGLPEEVAKTELLRVMKGKSSPHLSGEQLVALFR